nr:DNA-directed DNA polymerase [Tanacetum cinerariifolium]
MDLKTQLEIVAKNHQALIQNLKTKFDRLADKQSGRPSGSLPSNTQPNPRGSKAYQSLQARNEHVNVVFTRSDRKVYHRCWIGSYLDAKYRLEIRFHVEKRHEFLRGFGRKELGEEWTNESGSKFIPRFNSSFVEFVQPYSEEFMNVFMRIGFGSAIKFVSLDESQMVTFNSKSVCGFRNGDCETESRSDNTVCSPHGFIIHWIVISKNIKKVMEVTDVENWRVDNSRVLRWIVSLIDWNSSVSWMKSSIQSASGIIYPIADSPWVSHIHCVPKKGGITVVTKENDELIPKRTIMGWRVCIDYRKLNEATTKDHFTLSFMDQITYAYRRMPFGLCNAPATFQRCMLAIFHDMIEESVEVFVDDFSVFGDSFDKCLNNLDKML